MSSKKSSKAAKSMDKIRAFLNVAVKKLSPVLPFVVKFVGFYLAFHLAAESDLYDMSTMLHGLLAKSYVHIGLAAVCALLPTRFGTLLVMLFISVGLVKTSILGGILLVVFMLVIFLITVCLVPDYAYFLLLVPFCISKGFYLIVPLLAGLYAAPVSVIAIFMGTFMWGLYLTAPSLLSIQSITEGMELTDIIKELPSVITYTTKYGVEELIKNKSVLLAALVLCAVCFLTWLLQKLRTNYNRYIAVFVAGFLGILGLLVGKSLWGMYGSTGTIVLLGFAAMLIAALLCFLDMPLDYRGVRNISFSDDEYFYQVRLTPLASGFTAAKAAMLEKKSKKNAKEAAKEEEAEPAEEDVKRASRRKKAEDVELSDSEQKAETKVLTREETREIRDAELPLEEEETEPAVKKSRKSKTSKAVKAEDEAKKAAAEAKKAEKEAERKAAAEAKKAEKEAERKAAAEARKAAAEAKKAKEEAEKVLREAEEEAVEEAVEEKNKAKNAAQSLWSSFKKEKKDAAQKAEKVLDENGEEIRDVLDAFSEENNK